MHSGKQEQVDGDIYRLRELTDNAILLPEVAKQHKRSVRAVASGDYSWTLNLIFD